MSLRVLAKLMSVMLFVGCGGEQVRGRSNPDSQVGLAFVDSSVQQDQLKLNDGGTVDDDAAGLVKPTCGPDNCAGCCGSDGVCRHGANDSLCGSLGAECADCTATDGLCQSGRCAGCTPECNGKTCGQGDSCGATCKAGSGCCVAECSSKTCGQGNGCGGTCEAGSGCCAPSCKGKTCGDTDGCSGTCEAGSGCCTPDCKDKLCGDSNGCGGKCQAGGGSGCCTPSCKEKVCGDSDGCGGPCAAGSGCCTPKCSDKLCGASDGCKGTCTTGSGCCTQDCSGAICGDDDGCGGKCEVGSGCCTPKCQDKVCGALDGCGRVCSKATSSCCEQTGAEKPDRIDNDCDTYVDEGFWAHERTVNFSALGTYVRDNCVETRPFTQSCLTAAHEYCRALGYGGGYGPVEANGAQATVICLANVYHASVVYISKLERLYPACKDKDAFSPEYAYAIHEYCRDKGYYTGFGPVKDVGIYVSLVCIPKGRGQYGGTNLTLLQQAHPDCKRTDLFDLFCRAAVRRKCNSYTDYDTGFGLVRDDGTMLNVCLKNEP